MQKKSIVTIAGGITLLVITALTFAVHRATILASVELRTKAYSSILLSCLIILTSIPPMLGFTFATTLTGFIYGFPSGIVPAVSGAFFGAMIAFGLIRKYNFTQFIKLSTSKQEKYLAIQEAIEQGGFKMMMLIRLSPIPWPITNMLLSILPTITTKQFILSALISSFKVMLEVWIGSQLADISNPDLPPSAHRIAMMMMGCGVFILAAVAWWLYRLTMQKVEVNRKNNRLGSYREKIHDDLSVVTIEVSHNPSKKEM
ncbi:hypothetical protein EDC94DRAFT_664903 [Helicostylum pulchrum]|nr:hypothetical protein EDC94DRAFT_664903 [Helicostylum pulchrum]